MIDGHYGEGAEAPEHEGVRESGQRPFADDFRLAEHLPEEFAQTRSEGGERESGVWFGGEDRPQDWPNALPEQERGQEREHGEDRNFRKRTGQRSRHAPTAYQPWPPRNKPARVEAYVMIPRSDGPLPIRPWTRFAFRHGRSDCPLNGIAFAGLGALPGSTWRRRFLDPFAHAGQA